MRRVLVWVVTALGLASMSQMVAAQTISVSATYRERIAPPPDARLVAVLLDVSRADASALELGRTEITDAGAPPYEFEIEYDPAVIDPAHRYAVRSTLYSGDRMVFTTDAHVPVLTQGAPDRAEIVMIRVAQERAEAADAGGLVYGLNLPASFFGQLPCTDCDAIEHHLDLWPDQAFHLRRTWVGGNKDGTVQSDLGLWSALPEQNALKLWGLDDAHATWRIVDERTLQQLGTPEQGSGGTLTSDGSLAEADLEGMFLGGMMTYMADAATFTECLTGHTYPIAQEGDYLALERAYLDQNARPGAPLYVHVTGGLMMRPAMEGPDQRSLVVERYIRTRPGISCERQRANASLIGTYWRIDRLRGEPVEAAMGAREPHLLLTGGEDSRYAATVGCNQIAGGYEATGDVLSFGAGAATMMACPPPLDEMERRLADVLTSAKSYAISGETLALKDASGEVIALMTAVYFR
ncbi:YbaY family lipoprotein [Roseovarius nanhaiticus]|uniref:YbaY family lipoprotein n=1 Tax=Roseovarius nanhaiticus TaxID=573024 RepID=UPI00249021D9|nr:YbaY family lipoprotein [Roseovarius nanhaiticus]